MNVAAALAFAVLCGCWTSQSTGTETSLANQTSVTKAEAPRSRITVWEGTYECAQGRTGLKLTLERTCDPALDSQLEQSCSVDGIFEFGPIPENPSVPSGKFRMTGEMHLDHGELAVVMNPDTWIDQPQNYMMVSLTARTDPQRRTLRGLVTTPSCGELDLRRIR